MSNFEPVSRRSHRGAGRHGFQGLPRSVADYTGPAWQDPDRVGSWGSDRGLCGLADSGVRADLALVPRAGAERQAADGAAGRDTNAAVPANLRADLAFWTDVASHPQVRHVLNGFDPSAIEVLLEPPNIAMAFEHGGFIFKPVDSFWRVYELHTLFKPEGWGKPVFHAARQAFDRMFQLCDLIVTHETRHPQSRPPRTFRFSPVGEFVETAYGEAKLWMLSRNAWLTSPARNH